MYTMMGCISELKVGDILIPKEGWRGGIVCKPYRIAKLGVIEYGSFIHIYSDKEYLGIFNLNLLYKWNRVIRISFNDYCDAVST